MEEFEFQVYFFFTEHISAPPLLSNRTQKTKIKYQTVRLNNILIKFFF